MADYLNWCVWKPLRDGKPNGAWGSLKDTTNATEPGKLYPRKLVLYGIRGDSPSTTNPPHFSIDMKPGGMCYQHQRLSMGNTPIGPAYRAGNYGQFNMNREFGLTLQVGLLGMPRDYASNVPESNAGYYKKWWNFDRWNQLAWYLSRLCNYFNIPKNYPFEWVNPGDPPWNQAVHLSRWKNTGGILAMNMCPGTTLGSNPGYIGRTSFLNDQIKSNSATGGVAPIGYGDAFNVFYQADQLNKDNTYKDPNNPANAPTEDDLSGDDTTQDTGTPLITDISMEGKPFRFNPPLHAYSMPVRVDFSEGSRMVDYSELYDDVGVAVDNLDVDKLRALRLGRIVQHELAAGMAAVNEFRYGFRFLYNPTQVTIASNRNTSIVLDPRSTMNAVISGINQNFQTISFQLFLNRYPDVVEPRTAQRYWTPLQDRMAEEDAEGIRKFGTHWDLEYLYRVCNGIFDLDDRGRTSDIGVIIPSNARLLLGRENWFGFVNSISYKDTHFSANMVPVLTTVDISFRRHVDIAPGELGSFAERLGILWDDADKGGDGSGGSGGGGQIQNPVPGYKITTPYGKRGSSWSCNKNASGGVHTGADWSAPAGTRIVAPVSGTIEHRSYGSAFGPYQFAICPGPGQPFHGGEFFFAHTLNRLPNGTKVTAGQQIAQVGALGNTTGSHLHMEYMPSTKNKWDCNVQADPAPLLESPNTTGSAGSGATTHGKALTKNQVYDHAKNAGFKGEDIKTMCSIAMQESRFDPTAHNSKPPDNSYGLWQINMIEGIPGYANLGPERRRWWNIKNEDLFDPAVNAMAAYDLYRRSGNRFTPWAGTYPACLTKWPWSKL